MRGNEEAAGMAEVVEKPKYLIIYARGGTSHNKQSMAGWPNGKASDYESGDCGFEPHVGHYLLPLSTLITRFFLAPVRSASKHDRNLAALSRSIVFGASAFSG
jgi:hypothetical protein